MDALRRLTRVHRTDVRDVRFLPFIVSADGKYPPRMTEGSWRCENCNMQLSMQYIIAMTMIATGAMAQVRLPTVTLPALTQQTLPQTLDQVQSQSLDRLSSLRHLEIGRLIRGNARVVDADPNGEPVVRNEILGLAPTDAALDHARSLGFVVDREENIGAMNIRLVVFRAPRGMSPKTALRPSREPDPGRRYHYHRIY